MKKMVTTSTDFDFNDQLNNETTKGRDIRHTLIWVFTAALAAVVVIDLLG